MAEFTGAEEDRAWRVTVEADLTLPGHLEVFALGDMVRVRGRDRTAITFPGVAPVAIQRALRREGGPCPPEGPRRAAVPLPRQGNLATIGRTAAAADIKGPKASSSAATSPGRPARAPLPLVGFPNRLLVLIRGPSASPLAAAASGSSRVPRTSTLPVVRRRKRTIDASKRDLAGPMTGARTEPVVFVELDTRQDTDDTVSLEWDRDTGETQIVVADICDESLLVFPVPGANAGEAFRHRFRYAQ